MQNKKQRVVGRPKGSKSSSKFDVYIEDIMNYLQEKKSVSEIARILNVSRSSLKDYIESRELRELVNESFLLQTTNSGEKDVINKIECPLEKKESKWAKKLLKKHHGG